MKYDAKEFKKYPEIMNKEQMRIACHISKQTALYLLQFNLIPHTCTGKKTRCYPGMPSPLTVWPGNGM